MTNPEPTQADLLAAAMDFVRAESLGFDINDPEVIRTVVAGNKRRRAGAEAREAAAIAAAKAEQTPGKLPVATSVVYYMRVGNRVKIGYSTNLASRIASVMPEEVLAVEPGGRMLEGVRHRQFADLHVTREWFRHEGALTAHIEKLQAQRCAS
jgi:hypothetical protein